MATFTVGYLLRKNKNYAHQKQNQRKRKEKEEIWYYVQQLDAIRFISLCSQFVQLSSVLQLCLSLCSTIDCSMPGFLIHHQLPELTQGHVHRLGHGDAIQPSHPVFSFSCCPQSFLISGSFPMSQFFTLGGQIIGAWTSASIFPVNIQEWFV